MVDYGAAGADSNLELSALFAVELDGIAVTAFEKVNIDGSEWATINSRLGTDNLETQTSSGLKKSHVITIEKNVREGGWADIKDLINWHNGGASDKRSGAIIHNNREGIEIGRISFTKGWMKKVTYPQMDSTEEGGGVIYTFEIECAHVEAA